MLLPLIATLAHALELEPIQVGGLERTFFVHEPPAQQSDLPLLLVVHGGAGWGTKKGRGTARWIEAGNRTGGVR